jgi:hypothetical protein
VEKMMRDVIWELVNEDHIPEPSPSEIYAVWPGHRKPKTHSLHLNRSPFNRRVTRILERHGCADWNEYLHRIVFPDLRRVDDN